MTLLTLFWSSVLHVDAQDVTEVTLKGAFVFNFARFTEWPADALPPTATVSACVVGDRAVGDALTRAVSGQKLNGRAVIVSVFEPTSALPVCHVLYVSSVARSRMSDIVGALRETPVLTVSAVDLIAKPIALFHQSGIVVDRSSFHHFRCALDTLRCRPTEATL